MPALNVLVSESTYGNRYHKEQRSAEGVLKEHVLNFTPEWAYGITTIKPKEIRKTAR